MSLTDDIELVFFFSWQVADKLFIGLDSANIKFANNKSAFLRGTVPTKIDIR